MSIEVMGGGGGYAEYVTRAAWSDNYTSNSVTFTIGNVPSTIVYMYLIISERTSPTSLSQIFGFSAGSSNLWTGLVCGRLYVKGVTKSNECGYCNLIATRNTDSSVTFQIKDIYYSDNTRISFPLTSNEQHYSLNVAGYNPA